MERHEPLERLLVETRIANCQRKLPHCDPSERNLLLAILHEAELELAELNDRHVPPTEPDPTHPDTPQRLWFHNA
jgi:hypothetical protein